MSPTESLPHHVSEWHARVLALAWPTIIANVAVPLVGMVDTAVVGHLPDAKYIGAVAVGAVVFHFLHWAFSFLRMGTTGFTAQALGAGDAREINATAARALIMAAAAGLFIVVLKVPLVDIALRVVDASPAVTEASAQYLTIRLWSAPAALVNLVLLGVLFGLQRMRAALWIQLLLNVVNAGLDLYFVLVLDMGVAGVAWATFIAEHMAMMLGIWFLWKTLHELGGGWHQLDLTNAKRLRGLLVVNLNIFARTLAVQLTFFSFTAFGARQGDVVLAANAVLLHLFNLLSSALDGFAFSVEALAGNAFGARNPRALRAITLSAAMWSVVVGALFSLAYLAFGDLLIAAMTSVPEVVAETERFMGWVIAAPLIAVWSYLLDGVYFGTTRTKELRNSMVLSMILFYACAWALTPHLGNHGLWLSIMIFMIARAALLAAWYPALERAALEQNPQETNKSR